MSKWFLLVLDQSLIHIVRLSDVKQLVLLIQQVNAGDVVNHSAPLVL